MLQSLDRPSKNMALANTRKQRWRLIAPAVAIIAIWVTFGEALPASAQANNLMMQSGSDALATCGRWESRDPNDSTASWVCLAWINGATQAANSTISYVDQKPTYCTPRVGGSVGQYVAVFVRYLREHPERLHLPAIYLYHQSMAEAFPCE